MPISITCPCGFQGRVPDAFAGKKVRCKECQQLVLVTVPDDSIDDLDEADLEPAAPSAKTPPAKKPSKKAKAPQETQLEPLDDLEERDEIDEEPAAPLPKKSSKKAKNQRKSKDRDAAPANATMWVLIGGGAFAATAIVGLVVWLAVGSRPKPAAPIVAKGGFEEPVKKEVKKEPDPILVQEPRKLDPSIPHLKITSKPEPFKAPDGSMALAVDPSQSIHYSGLSPDGKTLYYFLLRGPLVVVDLETLTERERIDLPGATGNVNTARTHAQLSPDGRLLAYSGDGFLRILDLVTKKVDVIEHSDPKLHVQGYPQFTADSATLLAVGPYPSVVNVPNRKYVRHLDLANLGQEHPFALSPKGDGIAVAGVSPGVFGVIPMSETKKNETHLVAKDASLFRPIMSPSGRYVCFQVDLANQRGLLFVDWDSRKPAHPVIDVPSLAAEKDSHRGSFYNVAFTPDESLAVVCVGHRTGLLLVDVRKGAMLGGLEFGPIPTTDDAPMNAHWTSDGKKLVVAVGNLVKVWDKTATPWGGLAFGTKADLVAAMPKVDPKVDPKAMPAADPKADTKFVKLDAKPVVTKVSDFVSCLAVTGEITIGPVVTASSRTAVGASMHVTPMPTGKAQSIPLGTNIVRSVVAIPGSRQALLGVESLDADAKKRRYLFLLDTKSAKATPANGPQGPVDSIAISGDGKTLAFRERSAGKGPGVVRIIETFGGKEKYVLPSTSVDIALTPDGKNLILTDGAKISIHEIAGKKKLRDIGEYPGQANKLAVSQDGKWIAAAVEAPADGGGLYVWSVETGEPKLTVKTRTPTHLTFGPEDKTVLVNVAADGIRFFNLNDGADLGCLPRVDLPGFRHLALAPGGKHIVTADTIGNVYVYEYPAALKAAAPK